MKMCDECGAFPAEIHLTKIIEYRSETLCLCMMCAKKRGIQVSDVPVAESDESSAPEESPECHGCRMKVFEYRRHGRLGCPECYRSFEKEIDKLLRQVSGTSGYQGKNPASALIGNKNKARLPELRLEMEAAIKHEDFERAAVLRDAIEGLDLKDGKCA
jgi:protein arginine kinase activator